MADPVATSHHAIAPSGPVTDVTVTIDGRAVPAVAGEFLIAVAERNGVFIPRFCYHPRMKPVGMCRMCLVEVQSPRGATLQPACYVPVTEGMEAVTESAKVRKAQDGVLEFLLVNHPLDCPVCDKGGECPLQDQTLAYGPGESRFVEEKRHFAKPIPISDLVLLDRERCIQCGRCTRFAAEVAGEAMIDLLGRGDNIEVGIAEDHVFSSVFSGNTVQICPVGALTSTPYRFTARPWDLEQVESTCTTCAFGCRVAVQSSANRVTRLLGVDSDAVNHSWLCDKGRYAYEAVVAEHRLTQPLLRRSGRASELEPVGWPEALAFVADKLGALRDATKRDRVDAVGVIGGARLANEDAYAWAKLAKGVLGVDSVDCQLGDGLPAEVVAALPRATIDEACAAGCVITLTGDLREELPVLFLRLRGAAVDGDLRLVEITSRPTALSPHATATLTARPGDAEAVVRALLAGGAAPAGVDEATWSAATDAVSAAGARGERLVVVLGRPSIAEDGALTVACAAAVTTARPGARFLPALRRGNVLGAIDMGLAPGLLPGRTTLEDGRAWFAADSAWGSAPERRGLDTVGMLQALADGRIRAVVLLGADPVGDAPDRSLARQALERAELVVAVDAFVSPSSALADVVLPSVTQHERSGVTTNIEGRLSRLGQKLSPPGQAWADWMIASELTARLGADLGATNVSELWDEIEQLAPAFAGVTRALLDSPVAREGVLVPLPTTGVKLGRNGSSAAASFDPIATPGIESVERQGAPLRAGASEPLGGEGEPPAPPTSARRPPLVAWPLPVTTPTVPTVDGYSLRLVAGRRLYDDGVLMHASPSLAPKAPRPEARVHPAELEGLGVRSGARIRVRSGRGAATLAAVADAGMPRGVVEIGANLHGASDDDGAVGDLIGAGQVITAVRLETV